MGEKKQVFISYSHEDDAWCSALEKYLVGQLRERIDVWIDRKNIRAGATWTREIEEALARADLAILLVSSSFLASDFINDLELPRLSERKRNQCDLEVIPVRIDPCSLETKDWLKSLDYRPRGEKTLTELGNGEASAISVKCAFKDLVNEIIKILDQLDGSRQGSQSVGAGEVRDGLGRQDRAAAARDLLIDTLLQEMDGAERAPLAAQVVASLAAFGGCTGAALFKATRLLIEHCLLRREMPASPTALRSTVEHLGDSETAIRLAAGLRQGARSGHFDETVVEVTSRFFLLAREREEAWRRYFDALARLDREAADAPPATLLRVRVRLGFVAPQFLVAGLLSHFDDDWRPVLNAYQHSIPPAAHGGGAFARLQASQWNCWLVWGPSIPICRCGQWQGRFACQYGYGDESNSLPLIELESDDEGRPPTLDPLLAGLAAEARGARLVQLSGRLRWGPQLLGGNGGGTEEAVGDLDREEREECEELEPFRRHPMAAAQASLYDASRHPHTHHTDGLLLQLERLDRAIDEQHVYFSAYLWMMFLVTVAGADPAEPDAGPQLLRRKRWPSWPKHPGQRVRVREARLWEDLLPVFVHANIADPAVLRFQRRMLVDNALALLSQVWARRTDCFDADDLARGIRFHLVCASDYSGCGCAVRYPSDEPLAGLLRERLAAETASDFAAAVIVPAAAADGARPWGLARYFSSCHLPALVDDYFKYISQIEHEKSRRHVGDHR